MLDRGIIGRSMRAYSGKFAGGLNPGIVSLR
jgi:hypothetical protein